MEVPVYSNPGRRRRRRRLSAKQIAAGFGGKRRKSARRRRRNPALAALSANPSRRRRRRSYATRATRRRRYYRNPKLFGLDVQSAIWTAAGAIAVKALPPLVKKVWPGMPTSGPMGLAAKVGTVVALGFGARMLKLKRADQVVVGGLAAVIVDAFNEYVGPALGLSGYVTDAELEAMGLTGYIETPTSLSAGSAMNYQQGAPGSTFPVLMAQ